jgi:hypothetical protein
MLTGLESYLPTLLAIFTLVLFTPKTRWLCYFAICLAIGSEFIPSTVNVAGLMTCITCLVALIIGDILRSKTHYRQNVR